MKPLPGLDDHFRRFTLHFQNKTEYNEDMILIEML